MNPIRPEDIDPEDAYWRMNEHPQPWQGDDIAEDEHGEIEDNGDNYVNPNE